MRACCRGGDPRSSAPRGGGRRAPLRKAGFTLLEVMVALAILAAALLTISQIVSASLRNEVRAQKLDVATLLARGKMVELEERYERTGFKDFDDAEDGTFEDQGHAEVKWKTEVMKPQVDLSSQKILEMLTGSSDMQALLGDVTKPQGGGPTTVDPRAALFGPMLDTQLLRFGETIKKGVRELRLTVSWPDGKVDGSFTVVTHLVVLAPQGLPK
ncbi:MAG: prepilin-type N-terminal cleavage/methylation domain-containing protein [Anaeromyxobacteraceae bacterium]